MKNDQKSAKKGKSGKASGKQPRALPAGLQKKLDRGVNSLPVGKIKLQPVKLWMPSYMIIQMLYLKSWMSYLMR